MPFCMNKLTELIKHAVSDNSIQHELITSLVFNMITKLSLILSCLVVFKNFQFDVIVALSWTFCRILLCR